MILQGDIGKLIQILEVAGDVAAALSFLGVFAVLAMHFHLLWLSRIRLDVEVTVGANRQGLKGLQADQDNIRILIVNPSPKTVTVSSVGFLDKDANGIRLIYPEGLLVRIWANAKEIKGDEDSVVLYPGGEVVIVASIGLIGDINRCSALQVTTNAKYRKVMRLSHELLIELQTAGDRRKRDADQVSGTSSSHYREDCERGVELILPSVSDPISPEDEPSQIGRFLFASEKECLAIQVALLNRAKFDDANYMKVDYGASGKSVYDYHVENAVMATFMVEQGRRDELGKGWNLKRTFQSLGRAYRTHTEAEIKYREWCSIAESRRLSIYNQLTRQEDFTDRTRKLKVAHEASCDTCKIRE